jgi:hypothetical protein
MLHGPFEGAVYTGTLSTQPVSVLPVRGIGQLEVHEPPGENVPALVLRASDGNLRWARLLRPERREDDGSVTAYFVRDLRLRHIRRSPEGHRVRVSCFWEWGGQEGGLIYLHPDYSFRAFALSW